MATITLTTAGISNPSSTHRGYAGEAYQLPPASGGGFSPSAELTTTEYTSVSSSNNVRATFNAAGSTSYAGIRTEFYVDTAYRTITQIDFGMEGYAQNGMGAYGWKLYIRNNNTNAWDLIATKTGSSDETATGTKTVNLTYWLDSNYRIQLLMESSEGPDGNGSLSVVYLDYAYVTLTYTPVAATGPPMPQIIGAF
jgi:hypothetical protein